MCVSFLVHWICWLSTEFSSLLGKHIHAPFSFACSSHNFDHFIVAIMKADIYFRVKWMNISWVGPFLLCRFNSTERSTFFFILFLVCDVCTAFATPFQSDFNVFADRNAVCLRVSSYVYGFLPLELLWLATHIQWAFCAIGCFVNFPSIHWKFVCEMFSAIDVNFFFPIDVN